MIVNADDLGLSRGVNAGIFEAHERGIVTSASLMAVRPAARGAAQQADRHPDLSIGLHLDLDEVGPEGTALESACADQLEAFRRLLGRDPTHVDSHHHVHLSGPAGAVAGGLADDLDVPLRGRRIRWEGRFYGRSGSGATQPDLVSAEALSRLLEAMPDGWTELVCHPGREVGAESSYAAERELELAALCDPRVRAVIEEVGISLRSFADV